MIGAPATGGLSLAVSASSGGDVALGVGLLAIGNISYNIASTLGSQANKDRSKLEGVGKSFGKSSEVAKLLDKMPELTGSNREKLLSAVQDSELKKLVNELYRPGATVGDGGTVAKLVEEFNSGVIPEHLQKANERLKGLKRVVAKGNLGMNDLDIAEALITDLEYAINLFKYRRKICV